MKKILYITSILLVLSACSVKSPDDASIRLIIEKQPLLNKAIWGDSTDDISEINCIGVFVSYPPTELPPEGVCVDASGSLVSTPAIAVGTVPFNYAQPAILDVKLMAGKNRKFELIGFETHLAACPPFFGIDDFMKINSAPPMILVTKLQDIPVGESTLDLNGSFANKSLIDKCAGALFSWPVPVVNKGIFLGGNFTSIASQTHPGLASIDLISGSLIPTLDATVSGSVETMDYDPIHKILYIGGSFTAVKGVARNKLAAINVETGVVTGFNPSPEADVYSIKVVEDGTKLIAGGAFSNIGGGTRPNLAKLNTINGSLDVTFNATVSSVVQSVSVVNNKVFFGGAFTTVGGDPNYPYLASVSLLDGSLNSSFMPMVNNTVFSILTPVAPIGAEVVYVGGDFTALDGISRMRLAMVDGNSGVLMPTFNASASAVSGTVRALALNPATSTLYVGGYFSTVGGLTRNQLAAVNSQTGLLLPFNPNVTGTALGITSMVLKPELGVLYIAGDFTNVGGVTRERIAAVFTKDGTILNLFLPHVDSGMVKTIIIP